MSQNPGNSISVALERRENNFDFIRVAAATMVIFSHSYPLALGGDGQEPLTLLTGRQVTFGTVAVDIFFIISGFLVFYSLDHTRSLGRFFKSRALRIVPGLTTVVLLLGLVVGPLITSVSQAQYWGQFPFWSFIDDHLPGVFVHTPLAFGVDGSLWTIKYEVLCYVGLGLLGLSGLLYRRWAVTLLFFLTMVPGISGLAFGLLPYFAGGMVFYAWKDALPIRATWALLALAMLIAAAPLGYLGYVMPVALTYLVIWAGLTQAVRVPHFAKYGDFSYGLYIYAFPVQQFIVSRYPGIHPITLFLMACLPTLALAILSWHLVEKRALALKKVQIRHIRGESAIVTREAL